MKKQKITITLTNEDNFFKTLLITDARCSLERTVFPQETVTFEAFSDTVCEVRSSEYPTSLLGQRILCTKLANEGTL